MEYNFQYIEKSLEILIDKSEHNAFVPHNFEPHNKPT